MTNTSELLDKYRGALLGLAAGDALGTTLEFKPSGSFVAINDMIGGGPFNLQPGQFTDDTSMALCLGESLVQKREIAEIAAGSFKQKNPPHVVGSGYVVRSLVAALWAFQNSSSFREGALLAVNLGNDADTTGAIYGQLAGAFHGESEIPAEMARPTCHARAYH
jgi:ADP-ribosylglycohydrolase